MNDELKQILTIVHGISFRDGRREFTILVTGRDLVQELVNLLVRKMPSKERISLPCDKTEVGRWTWALKEGSGGGWFWLWKV